MRKVLEKSGNWISNLIDFFYPPFSRFFSLQFFRYGVSGASTIVFDWMLFFVFYNFIYAHETLSLGFIVLKPHSAALFSSFPISMLSGFLLQKYVTFTESELKGRTQLYRYSLVVAANLLINFIGIKLLVEYIGLYPTPAKMLVTIVCTLFSYFSQKKFTFKTTNIQ